MPRIGWVYGNTCRSAAVAVAGVPNAVRCSAATSSSVGPAWRSDTQVQRGSTPTPSTMTLLNLLGYVSDVAVLSTYWWMSHKHRPLPFHIANALGCLPLIAIEVVARTWQPLILSAAFGVLGAYGWYREATA